MLVVFKKSTELIGHHMTMIIFYLQEALKILRLIDDKIIYELNKSVPTASFSGEVNAEQKCRELYTEVVNICTWRDFVLIWTSRSH